MLALIVWNVSNFSPYSYDSKCSWYQIALLPMFIFEIINFTYAILLQLLNYHFIFRYHIFLYESFHEGLWPTLFNRMKNFDLLQLTFQGRYLRTSVEQMVLYWFELILLSGQLILVTLVSVLEACIPFGSEINQPKYHFQEF